MLASHRRSIALIVLVLAATVFSGCTRVVYVPSRPETVGKVLAEYGVTVCALDSTAECFVPTAEENRVRLAEPAAKLVLAAEGTRPGGSIFPGYYLLVDMPNGEELRLDFHNRDLLSIRGTYYSGGENLWAVVAELLPVSAEEHGLLSPLYAATEATVRLNGGEHRVTDGATIAALARQISSGAKKDEIPADLGNRRLVIAFTDGDSYVEVAVYENYAQASVWYYRLEGMAQELLSLLGLVSE